MEIIFKCTVMQCLTEDVIKDRIMEFVDKIREKVEKMGFDKKEYYKRIRPAVIYGRVLLRVDMY
jgi:hypothetical protein